MSWYRNYWVLDQLGTLAVFQCMHSEPASFHVGCYQITRIPPEAQTDKKIYVESHIEPKISTSIAPHLPIGLQRAKPKHGFDFLFH